VGNGLAGCSTKPLVASAGVVQCHCLLGTERDPETDIS
jgi:hypothetical protein